MDDNSNMLGPITSEADEVGGDGEDVSDLVEAADLVEVFRNDDSGDILCSEVLSLLLLA